MLAARVHAARGRRRAGRFGGSALNSRILLVEDDRELRRTLRDALAVEGCEVFTAASLSEGLALLGGLGERADRSPASPIDLVLLDLGLPDGDGEALLAALRKRHAIPLIVISARESDGQKIRLLDAGADDYLVKPFALEELLARVRALSRRAAEGLDGDVLRVGDLALDLARHEACRGDRAIELTAKEFALLEYLMRHAGRVLTKAQITDQVWGYDTEATSNVVEIYVHYLRDKIDRGFARPLIRTVRGVGYTIKE